MIKIEQLERIAKADDILTAVYWDIREQKGSKEEARRLDTILGKLYNLMHIAKVKH